MKYKSSKKEQNVRVYWCSSRRSKMKEHVRGQEVAWKMFDQISLFHEFRESLSKVSMTEKEK